MGSSPFFACWDLTIYCEAKNKPDSWDTNWDRPSPEFTGHTIWDVGPIPRNQANIIQKLQVQIQELAAQVQKLQNK
jgi:hypothetical protein